ncbi:hypothetical protein AB0J14_35225 [Micromonospora arborensis]|uniref:hypothetical protein n=1 Tax=Micromonospora TaxID=1873 RepID=UPI00340213CC
MGQRTLIGVINPTNRRYQAVYQQRGEHIADLLPGLRHAWRETHHGDTTAMAAAMIDPRLVGRHDLCRGHLDEVPEIDLDQLTLVHPDRAGVSVYVPNHKGAWLLSSRHRLAVTATDQFTVTSGDTGGKWTCTTCGRANQLQFASRPRWGTERGPDGPRTIITCTGCRSAETTDPHFAVTIIRPT